MHMIITRVMILGLELRLPNSYDFSKVTSSSKKFVVGSRMISHLVVEVLKVKIIFKCKHAPTRKFTTHIVIGQRRRELVFWDNMQQISTQ
jgi:hypothetical protein